jgi:serine/threonine protein kinase
VKLIDFGIAKVADAGEVQTQAGIIKGKYAYIAPEYTLGHLDLRADLFGLGVIAHELLTTRRLFHAPTDFETIKRLREMPIQPPSRWNPAVPRDVDDIVMTALQRDPNLRWQSALAMRTAIHNASRTTDNIVTNTQLAEWVEWCFGKQPMRDETGLSRAIDTLDSTSGSQELTTNQRIELEALGAVAEAAHPTLEDENDFEGIEPSTLRKNEQRIVRSSQSMRAPTRSLKGSREFETEQPTTVATPAYVEEVARAEAAARATPQPRTSAHVIRRDFDSGEVKTDPKPASPPLRPSRPMPVPPPPPPPRPEPMPLGLPTAFQPTLHDLVLIPEPLPENKAIAISLPPEQAAEAARAAEEAERARQLISLPAYNFGEDSGVVVSAPTASPTPTAKVGGRSRVWLWIVLALALLGAGLAAYLYFVEGLVPDLDVF